MRKTAQKVFTKTRYEILGVLSTNALKEWKLNHLRAKGAVGFGSPFGNLSMVFISSSSSGYVLAFKVAKKREVHIPS